MLRGRFLILLALTLLVTTQCNRRQNTSVSQTPSASLSATAVSPAATSAAAATPQAASSCKPGAEATPGTTEGPYFKAGSPEKSSLVEPGMEGTKLTITGVVLNTNCQGISNAKLDWWHADADGEYDNSGYRLRGHQFTDASGAYKLETIATGRYTGRTRHIHVKVQPPGGRVLTTQLFFPGDSQNEGDSIFRQQLAMTVSDTPEGQTGRFDFVLQL